MKRILTVVIAALSFLSTLFAMAGTTPTNDPAFAPMLKKVMPAVVNVRGMIKITDPLILRELEKQRMMGNNNLPNTNSLSSVGSGVIIDAAKGFIVTNAHVIKDAQSVNITLSDGRHFNAKVIGMDKPSDVALLQVKVPNLTAIPLADSNQLQVGDFVAAIGSPFGLNQSVTSGIVSALGRSALGIENYESFIQTDASINPGNSGGALINTKGQLVGINTAIIAPNQGNIGIGFAIPSNMVKSVVDQLERYGDVKRGILGVGAQDLTPDLANAFNIKLDSGAAVTQVLPGSPALTAGFHVGDIITAVNGTTIKKASDVVNTVGFLRVNSKVNIEVLRNNSKLSLNATLIDPKDLAKKSQATDPFLYGITFRSFDAISPQYGMVKGILIMDVQEDSNAWVSDLRAGDIVTSVNQTPVTNMDEFKAVVAKADKELLVNVIRGGSAQFLVINRSDQN